MRIDERQLGSKAKCSKCGEVFTLSAAPEGPISEPPTPLHNPFLNPFGAAPPNDEAGEPTETGSGFYGFQFAAPPPPSGPTPTLPTPTTAPSTAPFEPYGTRSEIPRPEPPVVSAPQASFELNLETAESAPTFVPRDTPPTPVVLEMTAPVKAPLLEQKIARIETFVVKLAAKRTLRGPQGAVIREGKATTRLFVKVAGSTGDAVGWSESNPLLALQGATVESTSALIRRFLRPALEGATLADVNGWLRRLDRVAPCDAGPAGVAKAVAEAACLDLFARTLEVPLHVLWGGARAKATTAAYPIDGESPKSVAEQMKRGVDRGATAFHVALDGVEAKDRGTIVAAAKSLPDGCTYSIGFLRGHLRDAALRLCSVAEASGATAVRGVLAAETPAEFARLAERTRTPLLADVGANGVGDVFELIRSGIGGVVLRPSLLGWRNAWTAALIAQSAGVRVWIGVQSEGTLGLAAAAHLSAALGTDTPLLDSGRFYAETHFIPDVGDGPFKLSDEIGVGVPVDETLLRAAAVEAG